MNFLKRKQSFTSIVGPNGSGKSNVIDALLFVFGFTAKKMRHENLAGLIHNSGNATSGKNKKKEAIDRCSVEVWFCEVEAEKSISDKNESTNDEVVPIPGSELVISRTATRDKSNYSINGKTTSRTEVTTLLKKRGIDLDHKRFLILQGEVELISQMKPKASKEGDEGLLEYLEDIIGTAHYNQPIEDSLKAVDELNQRRLEKLNRVKLVEMDLKALEQSRNEAEEYLVNENQLVHFRNRVYQLKLRDSKVKSEETKADLDSKDEILNEHEASLQAKIDELRTVEEQFEKIVKEFDELQSQADSSKKDFSKFERECIQLDEKKKHLKQKKKKLEKSLEKEILTKSECESSAGNFEFDIEKYNKEIATFQENLEKAETELSNIRNGLKGKTDEFQSAIDKKKLELAPWQEKINKVKSEMNIKENQYKLLEEKTSEGARALSDAKNRLDDQNEQFDSKTSELENTQNELSNVKKEILKEEGSLQSLKSQESSLREEIMECSQQIEAGKASIEASRSRDSLIKRLLHERDKGRLPGIYGRLGDLGTIDDIYDVAISSSYSERLKWIVVDTVKTAEKCLKILKAENVGRASFIVLERTPAVKEGIETPENAPRLIDLIMPNDPRFRRAFYYVVRDTLVANDLDQANRLAFGRNRWKVVTLDGKVIDKAGTMSGGGNKIQKGAMGSSKLKRKAASLEDIKPEDIDSMIATKDEKEADLKRCRHEIETCQTKLNSMKSKIPKLEETEQNLTMDLEAAQTLIGNLEKQIKDLEKSEKSSVDKKDLASMEKLRKEIGKLSEEESQLKSEMSGIQDEIQKLQSKILEVGGDQLRRQNSRINDIREQIDTVYDMISRVESQKKSSEKTLKKCVSHIAKTEKELAEIEEEFEGLENDKSSKNDMAAEVNEKCEDMKKEAKLKKKESESIKVKLDELVEVINEMKQKKLELENIRHEAKKLYNEAFSEKNQYEYMLKNLKIISMSSENDQSEQLEKFDDEALDRMDLQNLENEIASIEAQLHDQNPNLAVLEEYRERMVEFKERAKDLESITTERDEARSKYDDLRKRRLDEFMKGFGIISQKLKEMYQMITLGGNAELELVDSLDPFSEGIMFSVMPPKKSWKNISNLSGGEKTLSSLALVFALHHYKPTPLYVMDEIDAALDFRNVSIIANYIKERTKNAQFVIISLRNNMFELADRLVGIYKTDNQTKSITINPKSVGLPVR